MNIYVASSWRNLLQPGIVHALRRCGHEVYDFRHPAAGNTGFHWTEVDPDWSFEGRGVVEPERYRKMLQHPIAAAGYEHDITALRNCEAVVFVLPCGRSASWEFGYAMGQGKKGYVVQFEPQEPELMFREATIIANMNELFDAFGPREATATTGLDIPEHERGDSLTKEEAVWAATYGSIFAQLSRTLPEGSFPKDGEQWSAEAVNRMGEIARERGRLAQIMADSAVAVLIAEPGETLAQATVRWNPNHAALSERGKKWPVPSPEVSGRSATVGE